MFEECVGEFAGLVGEEQQQQLRGGREGPWLAEAHRGAMDSSKRENETVVRVGKGQHRDYSGLRAAAALFAKAQAT